MRQTQGLGRVGFIDEARGLDIIAMALYHAAYDLVFIFGVELPYYREFVMPYIQPLIAGLFIVLSGISCRYSRSNLKRGAKAFALGMALTAATLIFIPSEAIYFGILHFMGSAMMVYALCARLLDKIPALPGLLMSAAAFVITWGVPSGYLGIATYRLALPLRLYERPYLMPLGFGGLGSDYFPMIPYIFLYFAGAYLGVFFVRNAFPDWFYRTRSVFLSTVGRRTMIIYLLHQPIIMGILLLFFTWMRMVRA